MKYFANDQENWKNNHELPLMVVPGDVVVVVVWGCVNLVFVVGAMVVVVEVGVGSKFKMVWNIPCKRSVWIFVEKVNFGICIGVKMKLQRLVFKFFKFFSCSKEI